MKEYKFSYRPIAFEGEAGTENRISREQFADKTRIVGAIAFINKAIVHPFETALENSSLERIRCGTLDARITLKSGKKSTSWKNVYDQLNSFLEIRADDSRAAGQPDVKCIQGIGYCIAASALTKHIGKIVQEETKTPQPSRKVEWPELKEEHYPCEVMLPATNYRELTKDIAQAVNLARKFAEGAAEQVTKPFTHELQRWFYANTGYQKPDKIPSKERGFVERTLEIEPGSYIQIQLVPEETPKYQQIVSTVLSELANITQDKPSRLFRNTKQEEPYVNIKSVYEFLQRENIAKEGFIKADARYDIIP